jgi:Uncharacterized enzyme of phosphonate metabolism
MAVLARTPRADLEAALNARCKASRPRLTTGCGHPKSASHGARPRRRQRRPVQSRRSHRHARHVALRVTGDQPAAVGVACHLGRDRRRAELAALADALLQMPEHHAALHQQLIGPIAEQQAAERAAHRQDAASTRVEFFTMVRGD